MTTGEIKTMFAGSALDRCAHLRNDTPRIESMLSSESSRFVGVWQQRCLIFNNQVVLLKHHEISASKIDAANTVFLGTQNDTRLFAFRFNDTQPPRLTNPGEFQELRNAVNVLAETDAALVAYARAMLSWQDKHRYCGVCGTKNRPSDAGFVMACQDQDCGHRSFPRLDPAIIVLVVKGEQCLLGRHKNWPEKRFSTIAGFVEPGESLEDAIRREVHEETNIRVGQCRYLASQPWPFPAALMIGFHAMGESADLHCNDAELAEARWVSREAIAAREVILPPATSVAYKLIEAWFDQAGGPGLTELGLAGPPLRVRRPMEQR